MRQIMLHSRAESFIGGSRFDFANLTNHIRSVKTSKHESPGPANILNSKTPVDRADAVKEQPDKVRYCPQYPHIKDVLLQVKSDEELEICENF